MSIEVLYPQKLLYPQNKFLATPLVKLSTIKQTL